MTQSLRIALAQVNQSMGDLASNADAMLAWRDKAAAQGADLIVFPELQLIGYPPEDLVLKPALIARAETELHRLATATADGGPAMLVGTVIANQGLLFNCVALLDGGAIVAIRQKRELPNYGTFDEKRLFAPGPLPDPVEFRGVKLGLPICEDVWFPFVTAHLAERGAQLFININGSPMKSTRTISASSRCAARGCGRRGCRSPISIASAGRTSWCSTAPPSCSMPMATSPTACPTGRRRWSLPTGRPIRSMACGSASRAKWPRSTSIRPTSITPWSWACATM